MLLYWPEWTKPFWRRRYLPIAKIHETTTAGVRLMGRARSIAAGGF